MSRGTAGEVRLVSHHIFAHRFDFSVKHELIPPASLSLHIPINSVSFNVVMRTHGSNGRTRTPPPNRKLDKNAANSARPSNEKQRRGGERKDERATGKIRQLVSGTVHPVIFYEFMSG